MIVDLLRNDLGRVAQTGSVQVPALFDVQRYSSVLQMTSTVRARLRPDATLADIFAALYPCGSITGAPKRRTMEIIRELEPAPRGIYTGAIGWFDPPTAGAPIGDFCLSVPIRTLALQPRKRRRARRRTGRRRRHRVRQRRCRRIRRVPAEGALPDRAGKPVRAVRDDPRQPRRRMPPPRAAPGADGGVGALLRLSVRRGGGLRGAGRGLRRASSRACATGCGSRFGQAGQFTSQSAPLAPLQRTGRPAAGRRADRGRRPVHAPQDQHPLALRRGLARGRAGRRVRHAVLQPARRADRGRPFRMCSCGSTAAG